jgi:hypothetical protein
VIPRKLLVINALLLIIAGGSAAFIARQLMTPMAMPVPSRTRPSVPPSATVEDPSRNQPGAYQNVAARNLFSPTRTESPPSPTPAAAATAAVKPNLFGIVLREGAPIAYLEDPTTKRVAGYRVGDSMAGGTVQSIGADNVVIARPDGNMDVRLRDPGKPRTAPQPATAGMPGVPGAQPAAGPQGLPGVIPPAAGGVPGVIAPQPAVAPPPGQIVPPATPPVIPGRRPLPPNLLRRLPQGSPTDAPQQPQQ